MLEQEGWLPVDEGVVGHQGLHLAQEGVLEGVLEVLEVLEGVQEGMQGGLLEARVQPTDGNSGVYWDYTDGIAGLWHSDFTSSDQLDYPDYSPNYPSLTGNIQDTPSLYQGHYSDLPSAHASYHDRLFGHEGVGQSNLGQTLEKDQQGDTGLSSEAFGKPGPLIALLDLVGAALGSKPTRITGFEERVGDRRRANVTSALLGKLPEMLVIGRSAAFLYQYLTHTRLRLPGNLCTHTLVTSHLRLGGRPFKYFDLLISLHDILDLF